MHLDFNSAAFQILMLLFAGLMLLAPQTKGPIWGWVRICAGVLSIVLAVVLCIRNVSVS